MYPKLPELPLTFLSTTSGTICNIKPDKLQLWVLPRSTKWRFLFIFRAILHMATEMIIQSLTCLDTRLKKMMMSYAFASGATPSSLGKCGVIDFLYFYPRF